jgi:hypothetical protein
LATEVYDVSYFTVFDLASCPDKQDKSVSAHYINVYFLVSRFSTGTPSLPMHDVIGKV